MKFMLSYTMEDETFTEMGEVDTLPYLWGSVTFFCELHAMLHSYSSCVPSIGRKWYKNVPIIAIQLFKNISNYKIVRYSLH